MLTAIVVLFKCQKFQNMFINMLILSFLYKDFILYNSSGHHDSLEECLGMLCFHVNDLLF